MIGTFWRLFWTTGGSNDLDGETGRDLLQEWQRWWTHPHDPGLFATRDVNGVEIHGRFANVASLHLSTPANRAAWHERDALFTREEEECRTPEW